MEKLYIWPIGLVDGPCGEEGGAVRLAGGMAYANRFALVRREAGRVVAVERVWAAGMAAALARLPAALAGEGEAQWAGLRRAHPPLTCGARTIRLDRPQVMGILNVTPDSFSDGGRFVDRPEAAQAHAAAMLEAGAAIVDVGGESTRPGVTAEARVSEDDERARVLPIVEWLAAAGAAISLDSRRAGVIAAGLAAGVHVVNDVSALRHDPGSAPIVARAGVPVVLMHAPGTADDLHAGGRYDDVVLDLFDWLRERRDAAVAAGITRERIVLDPGIGFGKTLAENLALLNALPLYHALGQPLLVGASRKRMIGALADGARADRRLGGSLLLAARAMDAGVQLLRVHDVAETVQAAHVWRGLRNAALTGLPHMEGG